MCIPYTREFVPDFYEEEIRSFPNGYKIYPHKFETLKNKNFHLINLFVNADGLPDVGFFTKTDPICVLSIEGDDGPIEYGRTEVCWNYLDPWWARPFTIMVDPNKPMLLYFDIYDISSNSYRLKDQKHLGSTQIDLSTLLNNKKHSAKLDISSNENDDQSVVGYLTINFFDVEPDCFGGSRYTFGVKNIVSDERKLTRTNPFFVVQRLEKHSNYFVPVFKSAVFPKANSCMWKEVTFSHQFICGNDLKTPLRISVFDFYERDTDNFVGACDTSLEEIMKAGNLKFNLKGKSGKIVGEFIANFNGEVKQPLLSDYLLKGAHYNPVLAVDFSSTKYNSSNYTNKDLHFGPGTFSYQNAINDTADAMRILINGAPYNIIGMNDKVFTISESAPSLKEINSDYMDAKFVASFSETINLKGAIEHAMKGAEERWETSRAITTLIIISNGKFSELQKSIDLLIECESKPLIVLLVMMGDERSELQAILGQNNGALVHSSGKLGIRPIIKMVAYREDMSYESSDLRLRIEPLIEELTMKWFDFCGKK